MAVTAADVKRGRTLDLDIESAAFEGVGVARVDGFVVFVRNAVPGDLARVLIHRKKRKHAEGAVEEILRPSPDRVEPRCPHFGVCGGCNWQNLDYGRQLEIKRQHVVDMLRRIGHLQEFQVRPTISSPEQYHYRNKMEFSFGASRWLSREEIAGGEALQKDFALGLHVPRRFDKILDLQTCHLPHPDCADILRWTREHAVQRNWSAHDWRTHKGYLRNLVIRTGQATGQILVNLVTARRAARRTESFARDLTAAFPQVTTVLNSVNSTRSPVAAGEVFVESGRGVIEELLAGFRFQIGPDTFFQPNTLQAERLFEVVRDFAALTGEETVVDLYCGVGAISLYLASGARRVVGVEIQEQAVADAQASAQRNQVTNCSFRAGDAGLVLSSEFEGEFGTPDIIVLDPPRVGLHPDVCRGLAENGPKRIVYVSCNPATQARDLEILTRQYHVQAIQPVDMFPQTYHIENVVSLQREPSVSDRTRGKPVNPAT